MNSVTVTDGYRWITKRQKYMVTQQVFLWKGKDCPACEKPICIVFCIAKIRKACWRGFFVFSIATSLIHGERTSLASNQWTNLESIFIVWSHMPH
jgi:hypothetical protein